MSVQFKLIITALIALIFFGGGYYVKEKVKEYEVLVQTVETQKTTIVNLNKTVAKQKAGAKITDKTDTKIATDITQIHQVADKRNAKADVAENAVRAKYAQKLKDETSKLAKNVEPDKECFALTGEAALAEQIKEQQDNELSNIRIDKLWEAYCAAEPDGDGCPVTPHEPIEVKPSPLEPLAVVENILQ